MSIRSMPGSFPEDDAESVSSFTTTTTTTIAESILSAPTIAESDLISESSRRLSVETAWRPHPCDGTLFRPLQEPHYTVAFEHRCGLPLRDLATSGGLTARYKRCKAAVKKAAKKGAMRLKA
jgi:hypothetical protein